MTPKQARSYKNRDKHAKDLGVEMGLYERHVQRNVWRAKKG